MHKRGFAGANTWRHIFLGWKGFEIVNKKVISQTKELLLSSDMTVGGGDMSRSPSPKDPGSGTASKPPALTHPRAAHGARMHCVHCMNSLQKGSELKFALQSILQKSQSSSSRGKQAYRRRAAHHGAWTLDGRANTSENRLLLQSIPYMGADQLVPFSSWTSGSFRVQKTTYLLGNFS